MFLRFHVHTMAIVERHIERRIETNGNNRIVVRLRVICYLRIAKIDIIG